MRKVMMIMAALLMASIINAANLQWGIAGTAVNPVDGGWGAEYANNYPNLWYALVLTEDLGDAIDLIGEGFEATIGSNNNAVFLDWGQKNGGRATKATSVTSSEKIGTSAQNYSAIAFFQTNEGDWFYTYSGAYEGGVGYTVDPQLGQQVTFTNNQFDAGGSWAPVPEPTSVALLAIGVAVLGLRCRRA